MARVSGTGSSFSFTPQESGEYSFRVGEPGSASYTEAGIYAYGWGYTQNNAFEVNNEGRVDMQFDKAVYSPDEEARRAFYLAAITPDEPRNAETFATLAAEHGFDQAWIDEQARRGFIARKPSEDGEGTRITVTSKTRTRYRMS